MFTLSRCPPTQTGQVTIDALDKYAGTRRQLQETAVHTDAERARAVSRAAGEADAERQAKRRQGRYGSDSRTDSSSSDRRRAMLEQYLGAPPPAPPPTTQLATAASSSRRQLRASGGVTIKYSVTTEELGGGASSSAKLAASNFSSVLTTALKSSGVSVTGTPPALLLYASSVCSVACTLAHSHARCRCGRRRRLHGDVLQQDILRAARQRVQQHLIQWRLRRHVQGAGRRHGLP